MPTTPDTRYAKGVTFPKDMLCQGKCQGLVPEGGTQGHCLAIDLAKKNKRRAARNPGMEPDLYRMTRNYAEIAAEIWECTLIENPLKQKQR